MSGGVANLALSVAVSVAMSVAAPAPAPVSAPAPAPAPVAAPAPAPAPHAAAAAATAQDTLADAKALRRSGLPAEAAALLQPQADAHAADGEWMGLLGLCLLDAGDATGAGRALAAHDAAAGRAPSFRAETLRGRLAGLRQDWEAARTAYRDATRLNERAVEAWVGLVRVGMDEGRLGRALVDAGLLEEVVPDVGRAMAAEVLRAQGDVYRRRGATTVELAADKYQAALGKTPEDSELAELVLELSLQAYRTAVAAELVARHLAGEEHAVARAYWTGRRLVVVQDADGARAAFEEALARDPAHADSALWLAKLALGEGDAERARAWVAACRDAGLRTAQTELVLGEVLADLGELADAETHLRAALDRDPDLTKALYLLGRVLARRGEAAGAREVLERFRALTRPPPVDEEDDVER